MKNKKTLLFILAIFLTVGCTISLTANDLQPALRNGNGLLSILSYLISSLPNDKMTTGLAGIAFWMLLIKADQIPAGKDRLWMTWLALAFAVMQMTGASFHYTASGGFFYSSLVAVIKCVWKMTACFVLTYCLEKLFVHWLDQLVYTREETTARPHRKLLAFAVIWGCYLLILTAYFPGILGSDTQTQVAQYFGYFQYNSTSRLSPWYGIREFRFANSHPFLTTFLFGGFLHLGDLLGAPWKGIFLYSLLHSAALTMLVVNAAFRFESRKVNRKYIYAALSFYVLFVPMHFWAITMLKDCLFAMLHLLLILKIMDLVETDGSAIQKWGVFLSMLVLSCLYCVVRHQGLFILGITLAVLIVAYRKHWKQYTAMLVLVILICQIGVNKFLAEAVDVAPGGKQESYGIAFQQTARYVAKGYEVTDQEAESIRNVIDYDHLTEIYMPKKQDDVKYTFKAHSTEEQQRQYFITWWHQFLRHPGTYIAAIYNTVYGYFYMGKDIEYVYHEISPVKNEGKPEVEFHYSDHPALAKARAMYLQAANSVQSVPMVNLVFSIGAFFWLTLFGLLLLAKYRKAYLLAFMPSAVLMAGTVFFPVMGWRYYLPIILSLPILVLQILACRASQNRETDPVK